MKEKIRQSSPKKLIINWLVPLILVAIAIATVLFYPAPTPKVDTSVLDKAFKEDQNRSNYPSNEIATTLVYTFFNGSNEERSIQINALTNTLDHLKSTAPEKPLNIHAQDALNALRTSNINAAIQSLISLTHKQDDPREAAKTWVNIGNIQNLTSAEQALQAYEKASELDNENTDAWNRQATIFRHLKRFDKAETAYKKVQELSDKHINEVDNSALSFANIGLLNQSKGDAKAAEQAFLQSLAIYEKEKNHAGIASTCENLAGLYITSKKYEAAEKYYLKALESYQKQEKPENLTKIYTALGSLKQSIDDTEMAQFYYENALEISLDNNLKNNTANLYSKLGILAQQNGMLEKSKEYFEKSLDLNKNIEHTVSAADQYGNLAITNRKKGEFQVAEDFHFKAIEIYKEKNHEYGIISQKTNLGFLYKAWKKPKKACEAWNSIMDLLLKKNADRAERIKQLIEATCPNNG